MRLDFGIAQETAEKKRQRAERFGTTSESDKAAARAKRFAAEKAGQDKPAAAAASATADDLEAKRKVRLCFTCLWHSVAPNAASRFLPPFVADVHCFGCSWRGLHGLGQHERAWHWRQRVT